MAGTLYVIGTPIGNLEDVSMRAKRTLALVDAILCEDTRVSAKLLARLEVEKTLIAYHQHSGMSRTQEIIDRLTAGESLALITDAGTPGISDPGGKLIEELVAQIGEDVSIVPIPGPSAVIAALSVSGFPSDEFIFLGFPPHKKGRKTFFDTLVEERRTVVFYESTHRILKCLSELQERMPERQMMVGRELTKMHETLYRGSAESILTQLNATSTKGEFVVVLRAN